MSFTIETVRYSNDKHCFVSLTEGAVKTNNVKDATVFEIDIDGRKTYVSWSGETFRVSDSSDGTLQINGLFADKHGIKNKEQVILRPIKTVSKCSSVYVEPVSVDDWEILDRHTSFVESKMLDQIRVVQKGSVYPFWINKSTCIFIKIGEIEPDGECVLLVNETEVHLIPKVRSSGIGQSDLEKPIKKESTEKLGVPFMQDSNRIDEDLLDNNFPSTDSEYSIKDFSTKEDRKKREKSPYYPSNISNHWQALRGVFSYLGFFENKIPLSDDEDDDIDEADIYDQSENMLQNGLNLVLRVQSLRYTPKDSDFNSKEPITRRGSHSPKKNGGLSPRKGSRESPTKAQRYNSAPKASFRLNYFPQQPSTIYVDMSDVENQLRCNRCDIPHVFYAKLHKLRPPKEQQEKYVENKSKEKQNKKDGGKSGHNLDASESHRSETSEGSENVECMCVVRVIVVDRRRQLCKNEYTDIVKRVLDEQPLLNGHVIVPDMLRRLLKLDLTSRLWIQTYKGVSVHTNAFSLYPLGNMPGKVTSDMLSLAFREWLGQVSSEDYPIIVFQGLFVRFPVFPEVFVEAQITYNEPSGPYKGCYTILHPGVLRNASLNIISGGRKAEVTDKVIQPMLAYTSIPSIDPMVQITSLVSLGGVSELIETSIQNIEICLGSRPLYKEVFKNTPGLLNGMLLLTGPKGSGKTTLAKALSRSMAELPNLAYTTFIDCKPLRGKKVDTVQKIFELTFDEAAWRQPALIILDDLDHIAGSPAGPEFEMSGEALYAARVAEVVKDLLRKDIRNMTNVAVMATSLSRSSLHSILVSSRGTHLVQEVMTINPPDKAQRKEILKVLMEYKATISHSVVEDLDLDALAQKTEGFVARDLETIINRAVHAHLLTQGRVGQSDDEISLTQQDFDNALDGFTPASIRNVSLHQSGELGWEDIGGLTDVKEMLVETLQWPTKYPALYANCPLRLRSGLLLYGAPGTGKTLLAGVVAKECGLNFISIKGPELLSKYIGASELAVRDTFIRAQSAKPCILFFDEFDAIAPRRGHDNTGVTDRVVNQLLTQLDGVEGLEGVYVLAATSRPDLIDPALLRPGRLDKSLLCQLPNEEERLKILKALSRKMLLEDDVDFEYFAKTCQDYTGADFKALLYNAQLETIHEFTSQEASGSSSARFGAKSSKDRASKLKSRANRKLRLDTKAQQKSFVSGTYAYIPRLEEGVIQVSAEMEEKLSTQVSQIYLKERRKSEHMINDDMPDSPILSNKMLKVSQAHLQTATKKTRPSVSGAERLKYQRIYENFISSREGNFNTGYLEAERMKATLA